MILKQVSIPFEIILPEAEELFPEKGNFAETVKYNALKKAQSVIADAHNRTILGADTIVNCDEKALGKPKNEAEAKLMLQMLSDKQHTVYSGIALINPVTKNILAEHVETKVKFRKLEEDEIMDYISTGEPLDKAGSYGIQGRGALFIESIQGCFFNVMGLPVSRLWELLKII